MPQHLIGKYEVDPSTICQCTGLKYKNGKLIWENDIVDFLGHKGRVKYECGSFGIDWEEIESNMYNTFYIIDSIEGVIL